MLVMSLTAERFCMIDQLAKWIRKAEGDFRVAQREFGADPSGSADAVCYHSQQAIEKLMKALLVQRNIEPPHTHNLVRLAELL